MDGGIEYRVSSIESLLLLLLWDGPGLGRVCILLFSFLSLGFSVRASVVSGRVAVLVEKSRK